MAFDLQRVLRALLFASPGSLSVKDVQTVFTRFHEEATHLPLLPAEGAEPVEEATARPDPILDDVPSLVTASQIREAMEAISAQLETAGEVYRLQETHNGWRFVTASGSAEWVRLLRNQPKPMKLTQSALETLAIIAYRQPVTRAEIETIRGVSVESPVNRLLERDLIKITGRADLPGRPIQYGTTDTFIEFIGLRSLDELPASDVLSTREIDDWLKRANDPHAVSDGSVGLDTESGDEEAGLQLAAARSDAKTRIEPAPAAGDASGPAPSAPAS
jgi:segregation and condensation protein B